MLTLACVMYRWRKRFDVYVCTAADRQYALEVWRLLDPGGKLIPDDARQTHFRAEVQKKDIAAVLGLPANPGCLNLLRTAMPLALVLDDRRQVRPIPLVKDILSETRGAGSMLRAPIRAAVNTVQRAPVSQSTRGLWLAHHMSSKSINLWMTEGTAFDSFASQALRACLSTP